VCAALVGTILCSARDGADANASVATAIVAMRRYVRPKRNSTLPSVALSAGRRPMPATLSVSLY
jgi:hypothetical protein